MAQRKSGFNLSKSQDVSTLLDILENGTVSDLDEESDDEIIPDTLQNVVRVGRDIVHSNVTPMVIENFNDDEEDQEIHEAEPVAESSNQKPTKSQHDIRWRKHLELDAPQFNWSAPPPSEIDKPLAPIEYFSKYITDSLVQDFVFNTNLYATRKEVSNFKSCSDTEMKIYLGLHIIMGNLKFPRIRLFWDSSLGLKLFLDNMPRDRFLQLRNNLHVIDNDSIPADNADRLIKVRPLYDSIRKRCLELNLEQILCVDEQIVPFRRKFEIKQYVKGKPEPWGVKIFMICGKSGIVYDFIIYQGATTNLEKNDVSKYGASAAYVNLLAKRITNPGHYLFYDNYFSNYVLLKDLRERQIYAGGTIVAEALIKMGQPLIARKRGRLSSGQSSPINTPTSTPKRHPRSGVEIRPPSEIQYDTVDHLPEYDKKKEATRCKKPDCKGKTHVYCLKCEIHLCFIGDRNCFREFHQNR